jgi:GT2 family glycosyltransferase
MTALRTSVIIASYRRVTLLERCLKSLASQLVRPNEVIVVWQGDDFETKHNVEQFAQTAPFPLRAVHQADPAIVPAENAGLESATGDIILLIDDDAIAQPDWVGRHLAHYQDPNVGAVGGPYQNFKSDGSPVETKGMRRVAELTWYGHFHGNMSEHPPEWKTRRPTLASNLLGGNMSLRRRSFDRFEVAMKPYWELFEADACLQVSRRGFRVVFDYGISVRHYPVHRTTVPERLSDRYRVCNLAYNHAFVLSKHSPWWLRAPRLLYLTLVGSATRPGLVGFMVALWRHGDLAKQLRALRDSLRWHLMGWREGAKRRDLRETPGPQDARSGEMSASNA